MTQITAPIFDDAEAWLKENLRDFGVDNVAAVWPSPTYKFDENWGRKYYDEEEDASKYVDLERHVWALTELVRLISNKKLFVGGIKNPIDLLDAGNWDIEVVDAYFQLCFHDEVIYG